jgi:hypothetical protein
VSVNKGMIRVWAGRSVSKCVANERGNEIHTHTYLTVF